MFKHDLFGLLSAQAIRRLAFMAHDVYWPHFCHRCLYMISSRRNLSRRLSTACFRAQKYLELCGSDACAKYTHSGDSLNILCDQ